MQDKSKLFLFVAGASIVMAVVTVMYRSSGYGQSWPMEMMSGFSSNYSAPRDMMGSSFDAPSVQVVPLEEKMMMPVVEPGFEPYPIMPPDYYGYNDALDVGERVYEQSSSHSVVVNDVSGYLRNMKEYFLSIDGRVLSTSIQSGSKYDSGYLYVKVPVEKFNEATGRVTEGVKKVYSEDINAQDVTGQTVSLKEQLTKLEEEKAVKEVELVEAQTAAEKKRIELALQRLDSQIDALKKQSNAVEQRVTYSSISISAADSERFFDPSASLDLWSQFWEAVHSLKGAFGAIGTVVVWAMVYAIFWLPVALLFKKYGTEVKKN